MKKKLVMLTMAMMVSAFAFCGCGNKEDSSSRQSRPAQTDVKTDIKTDIDTDVDVDVDIDEVGPDATEAAEGTLEAFYNQPANKAQLDAAMDAALEAYGDYYSDCSWYCFDNTLTYTYVYQDGVPVDAASIEQNLMAQEDAVISAIQQESGVTDDVIINYVYYDADGNCVADVYLGSN